MNTVLREGYISSTVCAVHAVSAANKDLMPQVSSFMVEMVCRYTMVAVSQQAGNAISLCDSTCRQLHSKNVFRDVRKPNFCSVSVSKKPEPKRKGQTRNFGFRGFSQNRTCLIQIVNI